MTMLMTEYRIVLPSILTSVLDVIVCWKSMEKRKKTKLNACMKRITFA